MAAVGGAVELDVSRDQASSRKRKPPWAEALAVTPSGPHHNQAPAFGHGGMLVSGARRHILRFLYQQISAAQSFEHRERYVKAERSPALKRHVKMTAANPWWKVQSREKIQRPLIFNRERSGLSGFPSSNNAAGWRGPEIFYGLGSCYCSEAKCEAR